MSTLKIVMLSGAADAKAEQLAQKLTALCREHKMTVEVVIANLYKDELSALEEKEKPAVILVVGTNKIKAGSPAIAGLSLLYPWMGTDKMVEEIRHYYNLMT